MRSSRQSHSSLSSISSDRISDRNRSKSRSSHEPVEALRKSNRKMKFIIAVGVALPIIAAIIGVVAWAVSADSAFQGPTHNSLRRSDGGSHEEDIFQILENRQDMTYTRHPPLYDHQDHHRQDHHRQDLRSQDHQSQDFSRIDGLQSMNQNSFDDAVPEKDPLYIVHFVPSPKPKVTESSTSGPGTVSTVSSEVLKKILSASKGAKPGTPQFVVFAPMPSAEDDKGKEDDLTGMSATGLNFLAKPPTPNTEIDYDYEEELRKYQEMLNNKEENSLNEPSSRVGVSTDKSNKQTQIHKESFHVVTQNFSSGNIYQNIQPHQPWSAGSNVGLHVSEFNKQPQPMLPQTPVHRQHPQVFTNVAQNNYNAQQSPFNNHLQPKYNQPSQEVYHQPSQIYAPSSSQQGINQQPQDVYNQPQQVYSPSSQQGNNYQLQPQAQQQPSRSGLQPAATDRSGYESPLGIKLSLGGNDGHGKSLLGGSYSPLGIISSILAPVIRRPRVNLNGKLMFGVMLEKGVKLGHDKAHH